MNKILALTASVTFAVLLWPTTAAADVIRLREFNTELSNSSFEDLAQVITSSITGVGNGLSFYGFALSEDPNAFCALGCLGGQDEEFNFTADLDFFGGVTIGDISGSLDPDGIEGNLARLTVRFDGGTVVLPPITSASPPVGETFTLSSIPISLNGTASVIGEQGVVLASAMFESSARADIRLYLLEPGVPFEGDPFFYPCDKFGEKCWVLDRVTIKAEPVPEPTTLLLLGTGLAGVVGAARRKRRNH